jgi:hypothetical protein
MMLSRRSFFRGLGAILAAPPVAKLASLIPPVEVARLRSLNYLTLNQLTREAVRMFGQSNSFAQAANVEFTKDRDFAESDADNDWQWPEDLKLGSQLRIRLPKVS